MNNKGRLAEMKSANYLRNKGYTLVDHNFHSRFGEIDLV
ncbi:MAG: YraN family protein, partial [Clostridiales bacterium]|nr:YraN family protein [Clostridiales bacterium]